MSSKNSVFLIPLFNHLKSRINLNYKHSVRTAQ